MIGEKGNMRVRIDVDRILLFAPAITCIVRAEITKEVPVEVLKQAIKCTVNKYEILKCRIVQDSDGECYYEKMEVPFAHKIIVRDYMQPTDDFIHEQEHIDFDLENGELGRFIIHKNDQKLIFNLVFHHLAADGISCMIFLNNVMENLDMLLDGKDINVEEIPIQIITREYLMSNYGIEENKLSCLEEINANWINNPVVCNLEDRKKLFKKYWEDTETHVVTEKLSKEELEKLYTMCRRMEISINTALVTMYVKAAKTVNNLVMAVNMREKEHNGLGNYVVGASFDLCYNEKESFEKNAKHFQKIFKGQLTDKKALAGTMFYGTQFSNSLQNAIYFQKQGMMDSEIVKEFIDVSEIFKEQISVLISNVGKNMVRERYGHFTVEEVTPISPLCSHMDCNICMITVNNKMVINMIYRENGIDYAKIFKNMIEQIRQI